MMRTRERTFLLIFFVMLTVLLFVPLTAQAAEGDGEDPVVPDTRTIEQKLEDGEEVKISPLNTPSPVTINGAGKNFTGRLIIESGNYTINLTNVTMSTVESPITVNDGARLYLNLVGTNKLESSMSAGIRVQPRATLQIQGTGTLYAKGGWYSAGIGGKGADAGSDRDYRSGAITIRLDDGGFLDAEGGMLGAGIGGGKDSGVSTVMIQGAGKVVARGGFAAWEDTNLLIGAAGVGCGSGGSGGNITINLNEKGSLEATGGETGNLFAPGGPGIGCETDKSATVTIASNNVTAKAGITNSQDEKGYGVSTGRGGTLSSGGKSIILDGNSIYARSKSGFNGIVREEVSMDGHETKWIYHIYGNLTLDDTIRKEIAATTPTPELRFHDNATLTLGEEWEFGGTISGEGTILDAEHLKLVDGAKVEEGVKLKRPLSNSNIEVNTPLTYTGNKLDDLAWRIDTEKTGSEYTIDMSEYTKKIQRQSDATGQWQAASSIVDAGVYQVVYTPRKGEPITSPQIRVNPQEVTADMIAAPETQTYTGHEIRPDLTIQLKDENKAPWDPGRTGKPNTVQAGKNCELSYKDNLEVGTATVTITDKASGNIRISGSIEKQFAIEPATLENAKIDFLVDNVVYNGELQTPPVTVTLAGGTEPLDEKAYVVKYENNRDAGTAYVTVTPSVPQEEEEETTPGGEEPTSPGDETTPPEEETTPPVNASVKGSITKPFKINQRPLTVTGIMTEETRPYNGSAEIKVKDITLGNIIGEGDEKEDVIVDLSKIVAVLNSADAGTYNTVTLKNIELLSANSRNQDFRNYTLVEETKVSLDLPVEITPLVPEKPELNGACAVSKEKGKLSFTVEIVNKVTGATYEYRMDEDTKWSTNPVFDGLEPISEHTFYARAQQQLPNVLASEEGSLVRIIDKAPQDPPETPTVSFVKNGDGTVTAEIHASGDADHIEYSFDGINFSSENVKRDCLPNTEYIFYVRYGETAMLGASEPTPSMPSRSPKEQIAKPTISPKAGAFIGRETITISSNVKNVTIYYTLDGSDPASSGTRTTYTKPFIIADTTQVKAIAVKTGMEDSEVAEASYEKATGEMIQTKVTKSTTIPVTKAMKANGMNTKEKVMTALTNALTESGEFNYRNIEFSDIKIRMSIDGKKWVDATEENFPEEGLTITLKYPTKTSMDKNKFAVAHMFGETSDRLNTDAGEIEMPAVTETADGLEITVMGMSPVGIAWAADANGNNNNTNNNNSTDGNNNSNNSNNGSNGNDSQNGTGGGATSVGGTANDGVATPAASGDGTTNDNGTANGDNANANQDGQDGGLGSILPQTGDLSNPWLWGILAVICLLIIIGITRKRRKR